MIGFRAAAILDFCSSLVLWFFLLICCVLTYRYRFACYSYTNLGDLRSPSDLAEIVLDRPLYLLNVRLLRPLGVLLLQLNGGVPAIALRKLVLGYRSSKEWSFIMCTFDLPYPCIYRILGWLLFHVISAFVVWPH